MAYFTRETLRFLAELEKHNERPWFEANKERYVDHVKVPADRLVEDAAPLLAMDGKVMRIYRDVRFSKDKSPYKTNVGISFHPRGAPKGALVGGLYLHVTPGESFVATGCWHPEPPVLAKIRAAIVDDPAGWKKARKVGLDEDEEALTRPPKGVPVDHPFVEDLKHRNFTSSVELTAAKVTAKDLPKTIVAAERKMRPMREFLLDALR